MSDSTARRLTVNEYFKQQCIEEWDSLTECAKHHGVKQATIKELIHYGDSRRGHTFDIPYGSPYDTRVNPDNGRLEIYDVEKGTVLDGGCSNRKKIIKRSINGSNIPRLQRSSSTVDETNGNQQGLQTSVNSKRRKANQDMQAVGT